MSSTQDPAPARAGKTQLIPDVLAGDRPLVAGFDGAGITGSTGRGKSSALDWLRAQAHRQGAVLVVDPKEVPATNGDQPAQG